MLAQIWLSRPHFFSRLLLAVSLCGFSSCDYFSKRILAKPVVQVENIKYTAKSFSLALANQLKDLDALSAKDPKILSVYKDQLINEFVVSSIVELWFSENKLSLDKADIEKEVKAVASSYPSDSAFRESLSDSGLTFSEWTEKIKSQLKKKKLFETLRETAAPITEAELLSYYTNNRSRYEQKEMVMLSHILVSDENQAEIISKLLKKQKFTDIAQKYSSAYRAETGESYGWIERGFSTELDKAFRLRVGDTFGPVTTPEGLHIFKVTERRPFKVRSFAEAHAEALAEVTALREKALFAAWLDVQFRRYKVKKNKTVIESIKVETQ